MHIERTIYVSTRKLAVCYNLSAWLVAACGKNVRSIELTRFFLRFKALAKRHAHAAVCVRVVRVT